MTSALQRLLASRGIGDAGSSPAVLRRLALVLGLHTPDLFVIAGQPLPADLAPARGPRAHSVGLLVTGALALRPGDRREVHEFVRSLPVHRPAPEATPADPADGPGPLLVRLLRNRNIHPANAELLLLMGGPYVSDSTVVLLGQGEVEVTPQLVSGFAGILGLHPDDLAALTGVRPDPESRPHPYAPELSRLAWDARRLTGEQLSEVFRLVDSLSRAAGPPIVRAVSS